jgi:hypothetical protein
MDKYQQAILLQNMRKKFGKPHIGFVDEKCPVCRNKLETLLNKNGKNPIRCCWRCEKEK